MRSSLAGADAVPRKSRGGNHADLDITPMIDVTFLLLIFFMVTSTMQATPDHSVPPADNGAGLDTSQSMEIIIMAPASAGEKPLVLLDGSEASLEEVRSYVAEGVQEGKTAVIVMADRAVPHGFVTEVELAATEVEGVFLHIGVQDRKS